MLFLILLAASTAALSGPMNVAGGNTHVSPVIAATDSTGVRNPSSSSRQTFSFWGKVFATEIATYGRKFEFFEFGYLVTPHFGVGTTITLGYGPFYRIDGHRFEYRIREHATLPEEWQFRQSDLGLDVYFPIIVRFIPSAFGIANPKGVHFPQVYLAYSGWSGVNLDENDHAKGPLFSGGKGTVLDVGIGYTVSLTCLSLTFKAGYIKMGFPNHGYFVDHPEFPERSDYKLEVLLPKHEVEDSYLSVNLALGAWVIGDKGW